MKNMRLFSTKKNGRRLFFRKRKVVIPTKSQRIIVLPFKGVTIIIMIVLGFLTLFFALRSDIFLIHDIKVALDRKADWCVDEEKVKSTLTLKSRSILFANLNNEENNLKEKYLCIKDVAFKKDYPDRINLDLKIRTPFAKLVKLNVVDYSDLLV